MGKAVQIGAPKEWRLWTRINLGLVVAALVLCGPDRNIRLLGAFIVGFAAVQMTFFWFMAINRAAINERLAAYFRTRHTMFGGTALNRRPSMQRVQGVLGLFFAVLIIPFGLNMIVTGTT